LHCAAIEQQQREQKPGIIVLIICPLHDKYVKEYKIEQAKNGVIPEDEIIISHVEPVAFAKQNWIPDHPQAHTCKRCPGGDVSEDF
jgi:hypothetical protein